MNLNLGASVKKPISLKGVVKGMELFEKNLYICTEVIVTDPSC